MLSNLEHFNAFLEVSRIEIDSKKGNPAKLAVTLRNVLFANKSYM